MATSLVTVEQIRTAVRSMVVQATNVHTGFTSGN